MKIQAMTTTKTVITFTQDLLQIVKTTIHDGKPAIDKDYLFIYLFIDLGHYPDGAVNGEYQLELVESVQGQRDWENSKKFKSKDRFEIAEKLEQWMEQNMGL